MARKQDTTDLAAASAAMAQQPALNMTSAEPSPVERLAAAEQARQERELTGQLVATAEQQLAAKQPPFAVKSGRIFKPRKIIIHGDPGCGKTSAVADVDGVLLFDLNNGSEMIDVPRYNFRPSDEHRGHVPDTLREFVMGIRAVRSAPSGTKAIAVDMYTDLERLCMARILERDAAAEGKEKLHSLESYGYGKGAQVLYDQMREVLAELERLTSVGISVILVCHSEVVKYANPQGADYDRHIIRALNKKDVSLSRYLYGWADEVFFMHFDDQAKKIGGRGAVKGITSGARVLECDHGAAWDAKARLPLPPQVKVGSANPWQFMREAIIRAYRMTPDEIKQEIANELLRIGDPSKPGWTELSEKVSAAVKSAASNLDRLTAFLQEIRRRPVMDDVPKESDGEI